MNMAGVAIGEAARLSGVKVPTIRYYEQVGLLPEPPRTDGNRRLYGNGEVRRLAFIRHARELGFDVDAIRTLLELQDNPAQSCATADGIARARLIEVEQRIASLLALKTELERMVTGCEHGRVDECRVIEILADHDKCLHEHHRGPEAASLGQITRRRA
jgi:DNA-binding transcriptional MerR regulator